MESIKQHVPDNIAIGNNLSQWRKVRRIKADEMASKMEMSEANYSKYERGEHQIKTEVIQKAAVILRIDWVILMTTPPDELIDMLLNRVDTIQLSGTQLNYEFAPDTDSKAIMQQLIAANQAIAQNIVKLIDRIQNA